MVLQFPPADDQPSARTGSAKLKYKIAVGVGGVAGLFGIGSTLAANISLNNDGAVEFGQGVAQTAACDEDGFKVTPFTSYDNSTSLFRVSKLQVSGLNLTPVGWDVSDPANPGPSTDTAGVLAHPGEYFDGSWKKTCDGVVLDFKSYTSDYGYSKYTLDGYEASDTSQPNPNRITSPLMWQTVLNSDGTINDGTNSDMAIVFQSPNSDSNYDFGGWPDQIHNTAVAPTYNNDVLNFGITNIHNSQSSNASFELTWDTYRQPVAAAISKITVESMKYFPANYRVFNELYGGNHHDELGFAPGS